MDITFLEVLATMAILGTAAWKSGLPDELLNGISKVAYQSLDIISPAQGINISLAERLDYRDFYKDCIETKDGWLWVATELRPIGTDGNGGADWNQLGTKLNNLIVSLPDYLWIQVITKIDNDSSDAMKVFDRLYKKGRQLPIASVAQARKNHLKNQSELGLLKNSHTYVLFGKRPKQNIRNVSLKSLWTAKEFIDIDANEYQELREELFRIRETFCNSYAQMGGYFRHLKAKDIFDLAYKRLNPDRANNQGAANYKGNKSDRESFVSEEYDHNGIEWTHRSDLFAENPREVLSTANVAIEDNYFLFDGKPCTTISLHKLPVRVFVGLMETLTRNSEINFPFEISTTFQIENFNERDEQFNRDQSWMRRNLRRSDDANIDEAWKNDELTDLRNQLRKGEQKIGLIGLGVTFRAETVPELKRRLDKILIILKRMEGLEGVAERHCSLRQHLATLPCTPHKDFRNLEGLTKDFVALATFTNGQLGMLPHEALDVYERADGGQFFWKARADHFGSGTAILCGPMGSGKSGTLTRHRTTHLLEGRIGLTLDFGGSAYRLCKAVGGNYVDITDASKTHGLGLFAIRPGPDETFTEDQLIDGIPRERMAEVEFLMEVLCLDPTRPQESALSADYASILRKYVKRTYANLVFEIPTVDDFINTLRNSDKEDRTIARELAARLEIYACDGSLGRFLNDRSEPLKIDSPYTVFDFGNVQKGDARLMLVAVLGVVSYLGRFLSLSKDIPKFVDFDELYVIANNPLICKLIDRAARTARKRGAIVSFASQDPTDFVGFEDLRGIDASTEVLWLFGMSNPEIAQKAFGLTPGQTNALSKLQKGKDFRECLLLYPALSGGRASAVLRIIFSKLEARLALGAGDEQATLAEAIGDIKCDIHPTLLEALAADAMGMEKKK